MSTIRFWYFLFYCPVLLSFLKGRHFNIWLGSSPCNKTMYLLFCEYPQQQYASYLYLAMWSHPRVVPNQGCGPTTKQTCCFSCVLALCRKTNASDKQTWPPAVIRESELSPRGNARGRLIYINRAWHELIYISAIFGEILLSLDS